LGVFLLKCASITNCDNWFGMAISSLLGSLYLLLYVWLGLLIIIVVAQTLSIAPNYLSIIYI